MNSLYRFFLLLFFLCPTLSSNAQELRITKGRVLDSIPVNDTLSESFAIYLPQSIDTLEQWPVLFLFDPEGRGRLAAQLFRSIAEEQAYVIIASNENLKKESLQENIPKAARLITRTVSSLPLDTNLVYAGGLKEGAQLASAVPLFYKNIRGILAVGDAWVNPAFLSEENKFFFNAVVGDEDFRLHVLEAYVEFFKKAGFPTEINYFDGGAGEWPEVMVLSNAVSGFTLEAISKGVREKNPAEIERLYEREVEYTEVLRRKREYFPAFDKLEQIKKKYNPYNFEGDVNERLKKLRRTKAFRQQRREYRRAAALEREKQEEYISFMQSDIMTANFDNLGWWAQELEEIQENQESGNRARRKMWQRMEGFLDEFSKTHFHQVKESEAGIDNKIFVSVLRTILNKKDPEAYLTIIALAGRDGDYHTAMLYLEDLLKTGFDNMEALYEIEGILDLKLSREYNEKIKEYLGESKYYRAEVEEE